MATLKEKLTRKLLEFEKAGLNQYGKYLEDQLKMFKKKGNAAAYVKDIERQISLKNKKLIKIADKLKK